MAFILSLVALTLLATSVLAGPLPQQTEPTASALSPLATDLPNTPTPTTPATLNQSLPGFPDLMSNMLQPLINFNNRVSQAANTLPEQFKNNGEALGTALIVPIQLGANASNTFLMNLNSTILSVSSAVHPVIISPLAWMVNTTMGNMTLNTLNYSVAQLGHGINSLGGSVSDAGERLQNKGNTIVDWVNALDQAMRQLNSSMNTQTTITPIMLLASDSAATDNQSVVITGNANITEQPDYAEPIYL